ncbi:hypothetical protein EDD16DRAFT_1552299 [Pisolithus croceorrhizus]|nr:hypothetical protein EDD16DRAFT_1552299 [Pisolithus croceorrhizus]
MHRPTAIFGSDPQALARIPPSRAREYLRSFVTMVADAVPKLPALGLSMEDVNEASLMLDIQLQTVSRQVSDIATTIQQQHANMTFTAEILCLIVEVMQNHAPSVVADTGFSPDFEEFSARIDPLGETHSCPTPSLPPSDPWSSSSAHDVPAPSPRATTSNPPPHSEDTWKIPSDWDARGGGPRRLRREGAFIHKPNWDAMLKTYGRGAGAVEDDHSDTLTTDGGHASTAASSAPRNRIYTHENREHVSPPTQCPASNSQSQAAPCSTEGVRPHGRRSDSPDAAELRRRVDELKAFLTQDMGWLPLYQNKVKDRRNAPRSPNSNKRQRTPSQSPTRSPSRASPGPHGDLPLLQQDSDDSADLRTTKNTPASYRTPEPAVTPKISATAPAVNSGVTRHTLPRRGPLKRTKTTEHFD